MCPLMMAEMDYPLMVAAMDCIVIFGDKRDRQLTDGLGKSVEAELDQSRLICWEERGHC